MTDDVLTVFALLLVTFPQTGAAAVGNDAAGPLSLPMRAARGQTRTAGREHHPFYKAQL